MNTIAEFFNGLWSKTPKADLGSNEISANYGTTIKDALKTTLELFDDGLNVYMGVAERVQAMKLLNAQIAKNAQELIEPTPTSQVSDFFKNNSGMIVVGALGVLALVVVLRK
jgi:hypothetical protein